MKKVVYGFIFVLVWANILAVQVALHQFVEDVHQNCILPAVETSRDLAYANKYMHALTNTAREVVASVQEENTKLKAALNESTRLLVEERKECNKLRDQAGRFRWKIQELESIIDKLVAEEPVELKP